MPKEETSLREIIDAVSTAFEVANIRASADKRMGTDSTGNFNMDTAQAMLEAMPFNNQDFLKPIIEDLDEIAQESRSRGVEEQGAIAEKFEVVVQEAKRAFEQTTDRIKDEMGKIRKDDSLSESEKEAEIGALSKQLDLLIQDQKRLANVVSIMDEGFEKNHKILSKVASFSEKTAKSIAKSLPTLGGIMSALGTNSPIVGVLTSFALDKTASFLEERKEKRLQQRKEIAAIREKYTKEKIGSRVEVVSNDVPIMDFSAGKSEPSNKDESVSNNTFTTYSNDDSVKSNIQNFDEFEPIIVSPIVNAINTQTDTLIEALKPDEEALRDAYYSKSGIAGGNDKDENDKDDNGMLTIIGNPLRMLKSVITGFVGTILKLGKLVGKLAFPVTFVYSAFEGVSNAIDEYKETGSLADAARTGLDSFADTMINVVSFGTLDLDRVNQYLSENLWTPLFDWIDSNPFQRAIDFVEEWFDKKFALFRKPFDYSVEVGQGIAEKVIGKVRNTRDGVKNFFTTAFSGFAESEPMFKNSPNQIFQPVAERVKDLKNSAMVEMVTTPPQNEQPEQKAGNTVIQTTNVNNNQYITPNRKRATFSDDPSFGILSL